MFIRLSFLIHGPSWISRFANTKSENAMKMKIGETHNCDKKIIRYESNLFGFEKFENLGETILKITAKFH